MEEVGWILWVILGVVLIVVEMFTSGFVLLWFGVGALAAALAAFAGFGAGFQILIFATVSILLTIFSRRIFAKYYSHDDESLYKTGVDALPGQIGVVTSGAKGALKSAEVKVYGSIWTAFEENGVSLNEGDRVEVMSVKGTSIYVRRVEELPEWRTGQSDRQLDE